jgi:1-acyl-sn-glycerol-3-phosphate acyltransferase
VKNLRLFWRLLFFVFFTTAIVAEIWLGNLFFGKNLQRAMRVRKRWARTLLNGVGVRLEKEGLPPDFPCLLVSNHRSFLDPILMLCDADAYPVAKAELANWPVIGKGAQMAGILYLRRENASSRASILRLVAERIEAGYSVIIFPEGTTSALPGTLPFKKGIFQLAAKEGFAVVPVALCFGDARDFWVGKESFLRSAARSFQKKTVGVRLCYGPVLSGENSEILLASAKGWIEQKLLDYPAANQQIERK